MQRCIDNFYNNYFHNIEREKKSFRTAITTIMYYNSTQRNHNMNYNDNLTYILFIYIYNSFTNI